MSDLNKLVLDPTKRYNPLIKPTDAAWKEVEYTFRRMLDRPTLTIKQVLDDHFTPHERKIFLPAVEPRSLRECQEDSTRRYRALLAGRFKGHFPSLATKFAMLYFGLPVEPALSQFAQLSKPSFEIDDWEQLHEAEVSPPLHFLTAHDRRNFGYDHLRGTEAPYSTIPVPAAQFRSHSGVTGIAQDDSESQGLNLRGGGNDDDDEDDDEEMPDLYHHPRASIPPIPETPYVESSGYLGRRTPPAQVLPQSTPSISSTKHIIRNDELPDLQHHPRTSIPPIPETPYVESSGYQPRQRPPPKSTPTVSAGNPRVNFAATPGRLEVPTPAGLPGGRYQTASSTILPGRAPGSSALTPATTRLTSVPRASSNNPTFGPGTSTSAIGTGLGSSRLPGVGNSSHQVPPTSNPVSIPASFATGTGLNNQSIRANSSQGLPGSSSIVAATGSSQGRTPPTQHFKPSSIAGTGGGNTPRTPGFAPPSMPNTSNNQESASAYTGYGDPTPRSPAKNLAKLFGFQGRVTFDAANLPTLEQASRKLLSLKQRDQSDMVLDHMNRKDKSVVRSFNTKIPLPSTGDLANYVDEQSKTNQDCVWFVRRQGETTPTHWAPTDSDYTNHIVRLSRTNDFGDSDFAYYTVPRRGVFFGADSQRHTLPSTFPWGANQYMPFLTTAQEVLIGRPQIPGGSHCDIVLSGEHNFQKSYQNHWYGGLEIDYYFWLAMHPHVVGRTPTNITSEALPQDSVVFYLPGSRLNATTRELRKCSHKAGANDPYEDALRTMENLMRVSHMPVKASKYRIWRGTDFFSHTIYPTRGERRPAEWHHLDQTVRQQDQQNLSRFITDSVNDEREPCRLFVIQPVDGDVTCRMVSQEWNNGHQDFNVDSHAMATFKSKIRKLYEGCPNIEYDPGKHSILLQPLIPRNFTNDWNPAPFILRPNDPDNQLAMIRRRIIAEEVQISILQDDKLDFVKQLDRSEWGPRYGDVTRFRDELGLPLISLAREDFPHPPDERPEQRVPEENAREKTWSKQPSVFDRGIYNPSIPINAPPIEAIMRTGGSDKNLYLFNKNVLTATEQRDLQELGWKYRNMILDRQNGCPFEKCKYDYRQGKDVEFAQHLKESHVDNKCPWCDVQLFTHWTFQQREEHIKEKHAAQLRKILNMPDPRPATEKPTVPQSTSEDLRVIPSTILGRLQPPKGPLPKLSPPPKANGKESEYRYCDRCGRDHHVLNDRDERDHHDRTCVPHAEAVGRCTFCETCGDAVWNSKEVRDEFAPYDEYPHRCRGMSHSKKPFCNKCGFSLRKLSDEKIDRHRQHCGGFFAHLGCFCPYCQKNFVVDGKQEEIETIKKHIVDCPDKKPPNITPFEIYPEGYWKDRDQPTDPLYIGSNAARDLVRRQPRRPAPDRFLSYPLAWHDKPGPSPVQDPPAECTVRGCLEPLFGLTPSEVLVHYETKHGGMPLKQCPLCRLDFRVPEEERKANENLPEIQARIFQVKHMECHVYELWKILEDKDIPHIPQREPFGPGHSMWDPDNERAVDRRDKRCPYFEKCGAMVGFMNQRQLNHHMETTHGAEDFVIGRQPNREAELARLREERKKQRIREGKQPIPGTNTVAQSGPSETASTGTGLFEQPDNSRPGGRRDVNRPQESQPVTDPMQGVEIGESQIPPSGQRTPPITPYGPREGQGANTGGHLGDISGGGGGNNGGGSSSNPPKVVDPSTTKPVTTKPSPSKPVPTKPTSSKPTPSRPTPSKPSTNKPPTTKPTPSKPTSEPTVKPSAKPRPPTKPKPFGPVPVPVPTSGFVPDDDMYCSRCFRKAPKRGPRGIKRGDPDRQAQVDAHSDPNRSCRIPAKEGEFEVDEEDWPVLPSRVGWIKQPKHVRLSKLKADFLDEHPELAKTMCPTDGSKRTNLTWQHDPNHNDNKDNWRLPFPGDDDDGEVDEDEDENGVNEDADGDFINDEGNDDEDEEYYEEVEDADGNKTKRRKTRRVRSMGLPRDETWKDTGEEDDLSVADSSELVPETASGDEAPSNTGDKRKRDETDAQGRAGSPKKTRVAEDEDDGVFLKASDAAKCPPTAEAVDPTRQSPGKVDPLDTSISRHLIGQVFSEPIHPARPCRPHDSFNAPTFLNISPAHPTDDTPITSPAHDLRLQPLSTDRSKALRMAQARTMRPAPNTLLRPRLLDNACRQCLHQASSSPRALLSSPLIPRRAASTTTPKAAPAVRLSASYFLPNSVLERPRPSGTRSSSVSASASIASSSSSSNTQSEPNHLAVTHELPHRRRQAAKRKAAAEAAAASSPDVPLPQDASSALTSVAERQPAHSARRIFSTLLSLSKPRLSALVVLTAMSSYALYPVPAFLSPAITESPSLSPLTLLFLTTGTALCSASANSLNMLYEPSTDAKMTRTRNRPLVRGLLSTRAAVVFAVATALTGVGALYFGVNPTVAFLGGANIFIYAGMYTPMKAMSAANTWLGAVVGGIPPLMGWAAAAGETASGDGSWRELLLASDGSSIGGWLMAGLLFAWQFPHFMALSWPIREEYKAAGLRMLAWTNPARNARVALRYSIAFIPLCVALCAAGVTEWSFAVTSLSVNGWLSWQAVRFWKYEGHKGSARGLFWASVWHLPVVMVLALLQKKGMWSRVWNSVMGSDEDEWEDDELDEMPVAPPAPRR